jgi:hypothetical protein
VSRAAAICGAFLALLALAAAGPLAAQSRDGKDRRVTIVNDTGRRVRGLFAKDPLVLQTFEEDALGDRYLEPGQSIELDFDNGAGHCLLDLRVEFAEGAAVHDRVDVCEARAWRVSAGKP